jgi:3-oxoacyl-[acyl-carrier protein] reductase
MMADPKTLAAVVTGASSGIGAGIAEHLATLGYHVLTLQRRPPPILGAHGAGSIAHIEVDLCDSAALDAAIQKINASYKVGYLVNNAGVNRPGDIEAVTEDDLDAVWQLNIKVPVRLIKGFLPTMKSNSFGRIVNISSRAMLGKTQRIAYSTSKFGAVGLTRNLCLEVAPFGITVNSVAPGPVATALFDNGHPVGTEKREVVINSVPVKRLGTPKDIARSVEFFLNPESGFVTGQTLFVCGGISVSGSGGS